MTRHQIMGHYQFMFHATARDLTPVLSILESQKKLQYTPMRHVVSNKAQIYFRMRTFRISDEQINRPP